MKKPRPKFKVGDIVKPSRVLANLGSMMVFSNTIEDTNYKVIQVNVGGAYDLINIDVPSGFGVRWNQVYFDLVKRKRRPRSRKYKKFLDKLDSIVFDEGENK